MRPALALLLLGSLSRWMTRYQNDATLTSLRRASENSVKAKFAERLIGEVRILGILGSWTSTLRSSAKFAFREFSEVRGFLGALRCFVPWRTYTPLRKEYAAFVTWPTDAA